MDTKKPFERLPAHVVPINYDITLKPQLEKFTFSGIEIIDVQVKEPTAKIVLNAFDVNIENVSYQSEVSGNADALQCERIDSSPENETATFHFASQIPLGNGKLTLKFSGELNDKLKGFYRAKYQGPSGDTRYMATTQFEATDARRAFPCWDEPALKATFDISIIAPKDRVVLSNMNVISDVAYAEDENLKLVKFAKTPIMSTYLVAFVIGEFDYVEDTTVDGVKVRVYTPVGKSEQGEFSLKVATKVLPYYKDYFKVEYPLPKMDLICVPDFAGGAMENWGLILYRTTCLLVDPKNTSSRLKQYVALVVGHEIAHQWFGNLVTMEWWTHLWLNEGFASWIEFLCVDYLFPEYDIWTQFATETYIQALELDALKNSHPIEIPVGHPSEVDEIFDNISYNKGAAVIRMLHSYIGDHDFRKGMNHYLTKHKYGNTFTEDLWDSLEYGSGKPVRKIMSTWTRQMGYPVIKVAVKQDGPSSKILSLTQERFFADGSKGDESSWLVPISFSSSVNPKVAVKSVVMEDTTLDVTFNGVNPDQWIKLNPGTVGYFRCQYPPEMLDQFLIGIKDLTLPPLDRLGLLDDVFALVQAGQSSTVDVLKLMESFVNETNYTVWSAICSNLGRLSSLVSHTDFHPLFKAYGRHVVSGIARKLGWDPKPGEGHLDAMLRSLVLARMGLFGDEDVIAEAKRRFADHVTGTNLLPADLRTPVYHTVLSVGDEKTYETILKLYREADMQEEKDRLSRAMGSLRDKRLLSKVLELAMSDEVRSADTVFVVSSVAANFVGRDLAWQFYKDHQKEFAKRYDGGFLISHLVKSVSEDFVSEEKALEVEAFCTANPIPGTERSVLQSVENIRLNVKWLAKDEEAIRSFLSTAYQK